MHFVRVMGACSETALVCSTDATEGMSRILHILCTETVRSVLELWYESTPLSSSNTQGRKTEFAKLSSTYTTIVFSGNT